MPRSKRWVVCFHGATVKRGDGDPFLSPATSTGGPGTDEQKGARGEDTDTHPVGDAVYTYRFAPGELRHSTYDLERALITVNVGRSVERRYRAYSGEGC